MDGVSAAASILAIIDLSIKSASGVEALISAIKDGPKTVALVGKDVRLILKVLEQISDSRLDGVSLTTLDILGNHITDCKQQLSAVEALLKELKPSTGGRTDRLRLGFRTIRRTKDLEQARDQVHKLTTQLNVCLALVQMERIASTGNSVEQVLETLRKAHDDSSSSDSVEDKGKGKQREHGTPTSDSQNTVTDCEQLQESISRLSALADHEGSMLSSEDAEHIIEDLQRLLQSAKHHASTSGGSSVYDKQTNGDLRLVESFIYAAPSVNINQRVPGSKFLPEGSHSTTIVRQKRHREEIDIGCGVLTIATRKRQRLEKGDKSHQQAALQDDDNAQQQRDFVANFSFRPKNNKCTFSISVTQRQLWNYCMQSIPEICVNPVIPCNSPVFQTLKEGRLDEFRAMLAAGETSVRVHDENGNGLLYYAIAWPKLCKLLIDAGADVDEIGKSPIFDGLGQITPMLAAVSRSHTATAQLLAQNDADPFLSVECWASPMVIACLNGSAAIVASQCYHSGPYLQEEHNKQDTLTGRTSLHQACAAWAEGHCQREILSTLIHAGADILARIEPPHYYGEDDRYERSFTMLHCLAANAHHPSNRDELESLEYLIEQGCSVRADCYDGRSVSMVAYEMNYHEMRETLLRGKIESRLVGGYRGDLWDAALVRTGHDLLEFRSDYPRTPMYDEDYTRSDFERLWQGIEDQCPYWDDCRWPRTGGYDNYFTPDFRFSPSVWTNSYAEDSNAFSDEDDNHGGRLVSDAEYSDAFTAEDNDSDEPQQHMASPSVGALAPSRRETPRGIEPLGCGHTASTQVISERGEADHDNSTAEIAGVWADLPEDVLEWPPPHQHEPLAMRQIMNPTSASLSQTYQEIPVTSLCWRVADELENPWVETSGHPPGH